MALITIRLGTGSVVMATEFTKSGDPVQPKRNFLQFVFGPINISSDKFHISQSKISSFHKFVDLFCQNSLVVDVPVFQSEICQRFFVTKIENNLKFIQITFQEL